MFIDYVVKRGSSHGINTPLILFDVLETEKEHAEIFKHYMSMYSNNNEKLVKRIFNDIDTVTMMLHS
jgi:hypothetical protein